MVPTPVTDLTSRRTVLKTLGAAAAASIAGVTGGAAQEEEQFSLTTVASFDPPQLPENIAVTSDGTHYLSMATTGEIWSLTPGDDVSPSSVASLPLEQEGAILLGIAAAADDDSALYACVNSLQAGTHGVWRVPLGDGEEPSLIAETDPEASTLNGITTDTPGDAVALVTDHQRGLVLSVSEDGGAETWLDSPLLDPNPYQGSGVGVDGIAVGPDGDVFLDNLSFGSILRTPVESDGSAGEPEVLVQSDDLVGADGLTVDSTGDVYVAVNAANAVVRVTQEGETTTVAAGEMFDFPADVHFGRSEETERTLYVCNFALGSVQAEGQEPDPGYLQIELGPAEETPATPDETPTEANETEAVDETETVNETEAINETDVITQTPAEETNETVANETVTEGMNETEP